MIEMVKLFTLPPIPYKYIIINLNNPKLGYIKRYRKYIKEIIVDSGVEIFRKGKIDYENGFISQILKALELRDRIKSIVKAKIFVTIPDYPDDYQHKKLWLDDYDNIFRTLDSIFFALDNYYYQYYLIPVQGYNEIPSSIEKSIEYLQYYGVLKHHKYFAIANLCVSRKIEIIYNTLKLARKYLKNKYIHAFGISLRALKKVKNLINSFDSFAWTRPVNKRLKKKYNFSCKNKYQRILFFKEWYKRYLEIINN